MSSGPLRGPLLVLVAGTVVYPAMRYLPFEQWRDRFAEHTADQPPVLVE